MPATPGEAVQKVVAVVTDLFFVARIRETARLVGVPLVFARTPDEVDRALKEAARFALIDLTSRLDHDAILRACERAGVPVLAFTTHVLAGATRAWHARCQRVITKEVLARDLGALLAKGLAA